MGPSRATLLTLVLAGTTGLLHGVEADSIAFEEVATKWGLEFDHHHGASGNYYHPETVGSGVLLFDYDLDGDDDVLLIDGGELPGYDGPKPTSRLYRNDGSRRFVEVTKASRLELKDYGMGGTAGDVDGDGDLDLYLTAFGENQLLRNEGDGSFTEVTTSAGVGSTLWSSSAAFADPDGDGDLDLYVVNYLDYTLEDHVLCRDPESGIPGYCHPANLKPEHDLFYRNLGDGRFEDATAEVGLGQASGKGLGVVFTDLDGDGWPDVYVANDTTPNLLFRNRGNGTFEDDSLLSGTAFGDRMTPEAGMGIAIGDADGNGFPDLVVTNFALETNAFYRNEGGNLFSDARWIVGIAEPSLRKLGFGASFGDLDQDGLLDLVIANGHIFPSVDQTMPGFTYAQRNQIFVGVGQGRFSACDGCGLDEVRVSRGLAVGDLDGDLDLDLVFTNSNGRAEVYENISAPIGRALSIRLTGASRNTHGIGARVELVAGAAPQFAQLITASSYLSQGPLAVHFGVGAVERIGAIRVTWPDGARQEYRGLDSGSKLRLYQ